MYDWIGDATWISVIVSAAAATSAAVATGSSSSAWLCASPCDSRIATSASRAG